MSNNLVEEKNTSFMSEETDASVITAETESGIDFNKKEFAPMKGKDAKDFWKDGNTFLVKIVYLMDGEEALFGSKGKAKIQEERKYNNGTIYNVIVNSDDGNIKNRSMAYFYVEDEKIYVISNYDNNSDDINSDSLQLVFQKESIEEDSGEGLHYSITNEGDIAKLSLYTERVETNYFHIMEWGKARNINLYETGYGAGRDLFRVEFIEKIH